MASGQVVLSAFAFERIVVSSKSVGLSQTLYSNKDGNASEAFITAEGLMRYKYNGDEPTCDEGHILSDGSNLVLKGENQIRNFRIINITSDHACIQVSYERP